MACQLTLVDDFLGGTGAQQLSLPVYAHLHTPDGGGTEVQQLLSLSLCMPICTHPGREWLDGGYGV